MRRGWCNNVVPDDASLHLSCRYVAAADLERAKTLLERYTGCEVRVDPGLRPVENRADDPEIVRLLAAMDRGIPGGVRADRLNAATHAAYYTGRGFPVVIFSADGGESHCDREWGSLKSLDDYLKFFTAYFSDRTSRPVGVSLCYNSLHVQQYGLSQDRRPVGVGRHVARRGRAVQ